jgi:hypothetical protein
MPPKRGTKKVETKSKKEAVGESAERIRVTENIPSRRITSTIATILGPGHVMHIDPLKQQREVINMTTTMKGVFPNSYLPRERVDFLCWWCRHSFDSCPIGLPVSHHDEQKIQGYTPECYQTDGIFCSFPCAAAYLWENHKNVLYKDSNSLLHEMYQRIFGEVVQIPPAKSWKLLKANGGDMSINAFRNSYDEVMTITPNLATLLYQIPLGQKVFIS